MRVGDLASHLDLSARQIERVFRDEVGISPKLFLRIVRFQEVLGAIRGGAGETGWAEVAAAHGFYDQAHFIRDFKTFAGRPPGSWHVGDASLAAIFSALGRKELSP
jgi:transcriptional regulator GlxA family with amidase domain